MSMPSTCQLKVEPHVGSRHFPPSIRLEWCQECWESMTRRRLPRIRHIGTIISFTARYRLGYHARNPADHQADCEQNRKNQEASRCRPSHRDRSKISTHQEKWHNRLVSGYEKMAQCAFLSGEAWQDHNQKLGL